MTGRLLPFLGSDKSYVDDFQLVLVGAMHYPTCPASADYFRRVSREDEARTPSKRSQIGELVHADASSRKRQGHIVGHVFTSIIEAHASGTPLSLNKAFFIARRYALDSTVGDQPFKPSSTRGIRDAFEGFRDVGHFWAAQVIFPELFVSAAVVRDAFFKFVAVASDIANDISDTEVLPNWHPWLVPTTMLPTIRALTVPPLSDEKVSWIADYNSEIDR